MRILYDSKQSEYKTPFGVLAPEEVCVLHIRIPRTCAASTVTLVLEREDGTPAQEVSFVWDSGDADYDTFRCSFSLAERGLYFYWFRITANTGPFRLFKQGNDTNMEAGDKWQLSVIPAEFAVPDWAKGAVMYQIFPDRFCKEGDCDLTDKLQPYVLRGDWGGQPQWQPDSRGEVLCNDFFGGNFRGIAKKLDYLRDLGVTVLYLNPISYAFTNHRYDTADYKRPDPMLGTEADFRDMCQKAHARGMKVILDGVYSHTGSNSVYFDRNGIFGGGACSGEQSPYYRWYHFRHFPDSYDCWWNFPTLPCVNKLEQSYLDYVIYDDDSVIAHWLALGADGFRLDVVDELPDAFVLQMKRQLRRLRPDALLLGEVWEDASNKSAYGVRRRYFVDGELDSVMNYPWKNAIIAYVQGKDDGTALAECIMTVAENYPPQVLQATMNLLGSHDTARLLTVLGGEFDGTRQQQAAYKLTADQRRQGLERMRVAAFLQFVLPGSPCIYYGDEAGMEGCKDPFNRGCFPWGQEDPALQQYYRDLSALKKTCAPLASAQVRVFASGGGRIAFSRGTEEDRIYCYVNQSDTPWELPQTSRLFGQGVQTQAEGLCLLPGGFGAFR